MDPASWEWKSTRRFDGDVVLVTGASSGIGRAASIRLAREGARLCLLSAEADSAQLGELSSELAAHGVDVITVVGDISDPATAQGALALTTDKLGPVNLVVSNAGIARLGELLETSIGDFDLQMSVNVRGMFITVQTAAKQMALRGGGRIVCTCSSSGTLGDEFQAPYNISKAAVAQLVKSFSVDLARYGVRVNGVAPGWTRTPATADLIDEPEAWTFHRRRIPMDRAADPDEIAAVIAFLLSDDSSYITGAVIPVDGGLTSGIRGYK